MIHYWGRIEAKAATTMSKDKGCEVQEDAFFHFKRESETWLGKSPVIDFHKIPNQKKQQKNSV